MGEKTNSVLQHLCFEVFEGCPVGHIHLAGTHGLVLRVKYGLDEGVTLYGWPAE